MNSQKGFVKAIILIVIALIVLKYVFHIDFKDMVESKLVQTLWSILKTIAGLLWTALLILLDFIKTILNAATNFLGSLSK